MSDEPYERLASVLSQTAQGFTRTASRIELQVLRKFYSPEDALLASCLSEWLEPVEVIAARAGRSIVETDAHLQELHRRFLVRAVQRGGKNHYCNRPFLVGFVDTQVETLTNPDYVHVLDRYIMEGGLAPLMADPPQMRALPSIAVARPEWILPFDDVHKVVERCQHVFASDCFCRQRQSAQGRPCKNPGSTGEGLLHPGIRRGRRGGGAPRRPCQHRQGRSVARLRKASEAGLVHMVYPNVQERATMVCSCCGCCCLNLTQINEKGLENTPYIANYGANR